MQSDTCLSLTSLTTLLRSFLLLYLVSYSFLPVHLQCVSAALNLKRKHLEIMSSLPDLPISAVQESSGIFES